MWRVTILVWVILAPTLAGVLVMAILTMPSMARELMKWIPIVAATGAIVALPISALVARMITKRLA